MSRSDLRKIPVHMFSNPISGGKDKQEVIQRAREICQAMERKFVSHEVQEKAEIDDVSSRAVKAAEADRGLLIGVGGDGTARCLAQKIMGKNIPFAVVPYGTFNFFARAHRIPEEHEGALQAALAGTPKEIRLGEINGHVFLINASMGLYAKAIEEREKNTDRFGRRRIVVIASTISSLIGGHKNLHVDLSYDGKLEHRKTPLIFIGNNALQLRDVSLNVSECMKRDRLAVVMARPMERWDLVKMAFHGLRRDLEREENLDTFCVDHLAIKTRGKHQKVALDGELFDLEGPFHIRSLPKAITLMTPSTLA